jgi:hypothetical protein
MARTRRGPQTRADARVTGRAGLRWDCYARPAASPTGHLLASPTGHPGCRARENGTAWS